ncbi:hypothetical protein PWP93_36585 [Paraburkholderia sp. A1RI-2L]|uniref:hypothetical protein n=1 Tax=Paraburkholderia sp. A1RI-2L TaxID=3028367 RepID=UPI003B7EEE24
METGSSEKLHQRINDGVLSGSIKVVKSGDAPADEQLTELVVENLKAGRPLLTGMKVYRGSKDPDVDVGTFSESYKHATPSFSTARGYAETANMNIGLASRETHGLGVVAEYSLPDNALFFSNFGLEAYSVADGSNTALTVVEAESRLLPLAEAYMSASTAEDRDAARADLLSFQRRYMFELAVPTEQLPTRQWVVQFSDTTSRLIAHEDRGPLADVLIDVVKARKSAVDEHTPSRIISNLQSLSDNMSDSVELVAPGTTAMVRETAAQVQSTLSNLRISVANARHETLSEAIAWRRETQRGVKLSQLTNSGFSIQHNHAKLKLLPIVQEAAENVEFAAFRLAQRPRVVDGLNFLQGSLDAVRTRDRQLDVVRQKLALKEQLSADFDTYTTALANAAQSLEDARTSHLRNDSGNIFSKLRYRFGGERSGALATMAALEEHHSGVQMNLERASGEWNKAKTDWTEAVKIAEGLDVDVVRREAGLREMFKAGNFDFCQPHLKPPAGRITAENWTSLVREAQLTLENIDASIAKGREAASLFRDVSTLGLERALNNHRDNVETPAIARAIVSAVEKNGITLDLQRTEQTLRASSQEYGALIAGRVVHIDDSANIAVIDVGRREGMPIKVSDLESTVKLEPGKLIQLQRRDGKLQEAVRSASSGAKLAR